MIAFAARSSIVSATWAASALFMASSAFDNRWPKIAFADEKDYQKAAA
jgi:hypothetical protein